MKKTGILIIALIILLTIAAGVNSVTHGKLVGDFMKNSKTISDANEIVMTIGDKTVTKADFLTLVEMQKANIAKLIQEKDKTSQNLQQSEQKNIILEKINKKLSAGPEKLAVAYFVTNYALLSQAEKNGTIIPLEDAKAFTQNMKTKFAESPDEDLQDLISSVGDSYYWNEYAPKKYQMHMSINELKRKISTSSNPEENQKLWNQYVDSVIKQTNFDLKDNTIKVTKEDILNYKNSYEQ